MGDGGTSCAASSSGEAPPTSSLSKASRRPQETILAQTTDWTPFYEVEQCGSHPWRTIVQLSLCSFDEHRRNNGGRPSAAATRTVVASLPLSFSVSASGGHMLAATPCSLSGALMRLDAIRLPRLPEGRRCARWSRPAQAIGETKFGGASDGQSADFEGGGGEQSGTDGFLTMRCYSPTTRIHVCGAGGLR